MSRGNDVTMVLALNRISVLFEMFHATHSVCEVSQNLWGEFRDILEFLWKGINYACTEDWT